MQSDNIAPSNHDTLISLRNHGRAHLSFEPSEIGTHALCSGATMEMYQAGVPVYTIMLIGRWLSDTFFALYLEASWAILAGWHKENVNTLIVLNRGVIFPIAEEVGGRENWIKTIQFQTQPPLYISYAHFL